MEFSHLVNTIAPNILQILEIKKVELERAGRQVINLSAGTPDLAPGEHVMRALQEAGADPANYRYALLDLPRLGDAVIHWYQDRYGVALERDEYLSLNGTQEGFAHIFHAICDPGDLVIVGTPGYPVFSFGPLMAHATLYPVPLLPENGYLIDFASIPEPVADQAKAIVVSYPNNPLCATAPDSFYEELIAFAKKHDIIVIHDNAYSDIIFDGRIGKSFLSYPGAKEVGVEINSLSKSYNLTGVRISFVVGNPDIVRQFKILRSQVDYGMFLPVQKLAVAALTGPQESVGRNRAEYQKRRDALCKGLRSVGMDMEDSEGTMFAWGKIPAKYESSEKFTLDLLEKTGVIGVPGSFFGSLGEGYIRFALVLPVPVIEEAVDLIRKTRIF